MFHIVGCERMKTLHRNMCLIRGLEKKGPWLNTALWFGRAFRDWIWKKPPSRPSPICRGLGHLAVAEMKAKVINVASRLGPKSSHLPFKHTWKVLVFSQISHHAAFWGLWKGQCGPDSPPCVSTFLFVCVHKMVQWHTSMSGGPLLFWKNPGVYVCVCITASVRCISRSIRVTEQTRS